MFFRLYFHNCLRCVNNCDDQSYLHDFNFYCLHKVAAAKRGTRGGGGRFFKKIQDWILNGSQLRAAQASTNRGPQFCYPDGLCKLEISSSFLMSNPDNIIILTQLVRWCCRNVALDSIFNKRGILSIFLNLCFTLGQHGTAQLNASKIHCGRFMN